MKNFSFFAKKIIMKNKKENIYITFHYTTHGIAYMKHILSVFYLENCKVEDEKIYVNNISQDAMNEVFDKRKKGFLFDKIYYLTSDQSTFDKISQRRFKYRKNILIDDFVIKKRMKKIYTDVIKQKNVKIIDDKNFVKKKYPKKCDLFMELIWRDMQHYPIKEQIIWFKNYSNAKEKYSHNFEEKNLGINDLRDTEEIFNKLNKFIKEIKNKHKNANFMVNVSLGSNETQVAWHILAENNLMPKNSNFISTYDKKGIYTDTRFKNFLIKKQALKLFSKISNNLRIYENTKSQSRILANIKMKTYIKQGFTILLIGERGTGKTQLVNEVIDKKNYAEANCASFDDDNKAEADLFGYVKGAFTGADKKTDGLFHKAKDGILFLDEIHHLSRRVQAKLMTALSTDRNNNFTIRRLKSNKIEKIKCTVIIASNNTIKELREKLYPDLFDRITQLIIEFPPLRETPGDRENDWKSIWKQLGFKKHFEAPDEKELLNWLKSLDLYGNFRDLQKIAIYYHTFMQFSKEEKKELNYNSPFKFTQAEFSKYFSKKKKEKNPLLDIENFSIEEIKKNFFKKFAEKLFSKFGTAKKISDFYETKGESITTRTLYNWRNKK